jgi:hypothetical protein
MRSLPAFEGTDERVRRRDERPLGLGRGAAVGKSGHPEVTALAVEHCDDRRAVVRADDQVAFEMPDLAAFGGYGWSLAETAR